MKPFTQTCFFIIALHLTGLLTSITSITIQADQSSLRQYPITTVHFPEPTPEQENELVQKANQLRGNSIRKEFADIADIDKATMDFFVNFSAMTLAFYKREALNGFQKFNGENDVWRMYYGGGAAAHSLFPEYFRLKREVWRRMLFPERDDIAFHEIPEDLRQKDRKFMDTAAAHRRDGLNPTKTTYWNDKTLKEFQDFVLVLDKDAATLFDEAFIRQNRLPDFRKADQMADAIIRHEDRIWLFNYLNLTEGSLNNRCELHSEGFHSLFSRLQVVKSDKVLSHYFPELINSICEPDDADCDCSKVFSELAALQKEDKIDTGIPGTLMIGWFYNFEWQGDLNHVPLTRQLSSMDLDSLRTIYLGLLGYRTLWRYVLNETVSDTDVTEH